MPSTYRLLFDLLDDRERRRFAILAVMMLVAGLVDMAGVASLLPFLTVLANPEAVQTNPYLAAVSQALGVGSRGFLIFLGLLTFVFVVFGQSWKAATAYAMTRFGRLRENSIGSRLLSHYLHQPYAWFLNRNSADLGKTILSEVDKVVQGSLIPALRVLAQAVVIICLVALLLAVDPMATAIIAFVVGGSYGLITMSARRYLARIGHDRVLANTERYRIVQEVFGGIKEVKLRSLEDAYVTRFRGSSVRFVKHQAAASIVAQLPRYLLETIVFGGMIFLLLVLLVTSDGTLQSVLPVVGVFAFAGARLFPALQQFYGALTEMSFTRNALVALHADLQQTSGSVVRTGGALPPILLRETLELDNVSFTYDGARTAALSGLSLVIRANTTVGLIGPTGAGKTTVVDVMLGLLEPQRGSLRVDGTVIEGENLNAWRRGIGYVPQHIFLTDDTVAANIAVGVPPEQIDMAAVQKAARIAVLDTFVTGELKHGYATKIGERGVRLSGGQRQRIGIARALYHDPQVLILDEATSALDNATEAAFMEAVRDLGHKKTIIIVAHRLTTVQTCDEVFLLQAGTCAAAGPPNEILSLSSGGARLIASA